MKPRVQFSLRASIIATTWAAIFLANWFLARRDMAYLERGWVVMALVVLPPPAIVGALAGRHLLGILCGVASMTALMAWDLFPIFTI
jgi:hypothetical protein